MLYNYNSEFEKIDTPDKAYILGLWYADGFVSYNPEKHSYFSGVKLHIKDLKLLENIKNRFAFFSLKTSESTCIIRCNKKLFCEHLLSNGVLIRKSSENKNNLKFPDISPDLYSHFIRGYFDGDGSIFFNKNNSKNTKVFCITSDNYKLIKKMREILYHENIRTSFSYVRGGQSIIRGEKVQFKELSFIIKSSNRLTIERLSNYLYRNAELYLSRKFITFITWFETYKSTAPKCPLCKSNKTQWQIKHKYIICRNCNKYSKITAPLEGNF